MTEAWRSVRLVMLRRLAFALAAFLAVVVVNPAAAHLTPNSEIRLHFEPGAVRAEILIPAGELAYATGLSANNRRASLEAAGRYLLDHARVRTPDGRVWAEDLARIAVVAAPGGPDLVASLRFIAPSGASDRTLTLHWDAVIERSPGHFALVAVESDIADGMAEANDLLGSVTAERPTIAVDRAAQGARGLFAGAMQLGAHHILAGYDHLLFLLALLLPAPLVAAGKRWGEPRPVEEAVRALVAVVTAFTVGHSLTLIAAALFKLSLWAAPVEAAIALSVLISSIHAWRPLFPGREPWVAAAFGLVHGLAFATVVAGFGVAATTRATAILGFNLGIEAIQLALVALLLPALLIGARTRFYRTARHVLCTVTAAAALAWLAERLSGRQLAVAAMFERILPLIGLGLSALSLALAIRWLLRPGRTTVAAGGLQA